MIMPAEQRCPICDRIFVGPDAIGDPCDECRFEEWSKSLKLVIELNKRDKDK